MLRILWVDERRDYGEERLITVGMTQAGDLLYIVHAERGGRIRLITARRANAYERGLYHEN
jgi:uncharacterized DUF497 family protein